MDFCRAAISNVLLMEGGLVNDPNDPGGLTKFGISKKAYPDIDIASLTVEQATEIYRKEWAEVLGDTLPPPLALLVFDHAVNAGRSRSVRILQAVSDAGIDGVMGPQTVEAAKFYYARRGADALRFFTERRLSYYRSIDGWEHFAAGWIKRSLFMLVTAVQWDCAITSLRVNGAVTS